MADAASKTEDTLAEAIADKDSKPWLDSIAEAERTFESYQTRCDRVEKLYGNLANLAEDSTERELQIFWANLEVLKPSLYARPPVPVVMPRFKDYKPLPRKAAELVERSLTVSFELEDIDSTMKMVRDDLAMAARGVPWVRYEKKKGKPEKICYEHVDRRDFLHEPARKWPEVGWVARRSWLDKQEFKARFPDVSLLGVQFSDRGTVENNAQSEDDYTVKKAGVWEIWSKTKNIVVWVVTGVEDTLDQKPPFLTLEGFFPCPRPAYGTLQPRSLIPIPDFLYYRDQIEEINELTARISALSESLRLKGFYGGGAEDVVSAVEAAIRSNDNNAILIPVSNFAEMGGASLKDSIVWLPVAEVASVIKQLIELRRQLIEDIYQITGLSDIMRGDTNPNETLGAQELKSQYGSVRIRDRQSELVRIARDLTRIGAEIMAENFDPKTLLSMSQIDDLPAQAEIDGQIQQIVDQAKQIASDPQAQQMAQQNPDQAKQMIQQVQGQIKELQETVTIEKVMDMLRSQQARPFILDIETDSTIQPDENADKQRTTEYVTAVGTFIANAGPMVQQEPASAPFVAEVLKFIAAKFRAGRELEGTIEEFADTIKQKAAQPQQQGPSEADIAMKESQATFMMKKQEMDGKAKMDEMKTQVEMGRVALEKMKVEAELAGNDADRKLKEQESVNKTVLEQAQLEIEKERLEIEKERLRLETAKVELEMEKFGSESSFKAKDFDLRMASTDNVMNGESGPENVNGSLASLLAQVSQQLAE
ncbi:MAG TPA: hypothetical protein VMW24_01620, partial [Sedimentisphaerales bacterium]|nr:hypothetical protein [Sedimentisphaerales bacterium]